MPQKKRTRARLDSVVAAAEDAWADSGASQGLLDSLTFVITDLEDRALAKTAGTVVFIDATAAGWGWFVDATPDDDDEYELRAEATLTAAPTSLASGRIDLLTVLLHEIGHALGLHHDDELGVMSATLDIGQRRTLHKVPRVSPVSQSPTPSVRPWHTPGPLDASRFITGNDSAQIAEMVIIAGDAMQWRWRAIRRRSRSPMMWRASSARAIRLG